GKVKRCSVEGHKLRVELGDSRHKALAATILIVNQRSTRCKCHSFGNARRTVLAELFRRNLNNAARSHIHSLNALRPRLACRLEQKNEAIRVADYLHVLRQVRGFGGELSEPCMCERPDERRRINATIFGRRVKDPGTVPQDREEGARDEQWK